MNIHVEFQKFLNERGILLTREQERTVKLLLDHECTWMRAKASGVTFLFNTLEDFFKNHRPEPT